MTASESHELALPTQGSPSHQHEYGAKAVAICITRAARNELSEDSMDPSSWTSGTLGDGISSQTVHCMAVSIRVGGVEH